MYKKNLLIAAPLLIIFISFTPVQGVSNENGEQQCLLDDQQDTRPDEYYSKLSIFKFGKQQDEEKDSKDNDVYSTTFIEGFMKAFSGCFCCQNKPKKEPLGHSKRRLALPLFGLGPF